jgi:hypothetical protein
MMEKIYKNWLKPENFLIASSLQDSLSFLYLGDFQELGFGDEFDDETLLVENSDVKISPDVDNRCISVCIESDLFVYNIDFDKYYYDNDDEDSITSDEADVLVEEELDDICDAVINIITRIINEHHKNNPAKFVQMCLAVI